MAEYRLAKVATELNRSFQVLADVLNQRGFDVMPKPTTKITEDMYQALLREFSADKAAKDEAKLLKTNRDNKPTPPPAPAPAAKPTTPVAKPAVEEEVKTPEPAAEKLVTRSEEVVGPKILGKIDIGGKKPKAVDVPAVVESAPIAEEPKEIAPAVEAKEVVSAPPVEEKTPEPTPEPVVEAPAAQAESKTAAPVTEEEDIEKIDTKFEVLSGPKVLGKINLPTVAPTGVKSLAGEARDDLREKRKRKRKQAGTEKVAVQERVKQDQTTSSNNTDNRTAPKAEISKEAVQQKVRNTMGQMGNAGRSRGMKQKNQTEKQGRPRQRPQRNQPPQRKGKQNPESNRIPHRQRIGHHDEYQRYPGYLLLFYVGIDRFYQPTSRC